MFQKRFAICESFLAQDPTHDIWHKANIHNPSHLNGASTKKKLIIRKLNVIIILQCARSDTSDSTAIRR